MNNPAIIALKRWTIGVNDPSFIAWLIFATYFVTAILCWRARASALPDKQREARVLWTVLSFLLILLGLNKQLDLHKLFMDVGRELFAEQGWQDHSGVLLGVIVVGMGVLGIPVVLLGAKFLRRSDRNVCWAYGIFAGLLGAFVLRFLPGPISDFLVSHLFTEEEGLLHVHMVELVELGSLAIIGSLAFAKVYINKVGPKSSALDRRSLA